MGVQCGHKRIVEKVTILLFLVSKLLQEKMEKLKSTAKNAKILATQVGLEKTLNTCVNIIVKIETN